MGGGAWPFLVGGVICLVNSDNERDSVLLNSVGFSFEPTILLRGTAKGPTFSVFLKKNLLKKIKKIFLFNKSFLKRIFAYKNDFFGFLGLGEAP